MLLSNRYGATGHHGVSGFHDLRSNDLPLNPMECDKNILLVNANTKKVAYLSPTVAGTTHDKKATDDAQIAYPHNATLDKDTGFQGDEPTGTQTRQPKKSPKAKS